MKINIGVVMTPKTAQIKAPVWIWLAALTMVLQELAGAVIQPLTIVTGITFALTLLLVWLLLRGSRIAWSVVVLVSSLEVVLAIAGSDSLWLAGVAGLRMGLLLNVVSLTFFWRDRREDLISSPVTRGSREAGWNSFLWRERVLSSTPLEWIQGVIADIELEAQGARATHNKLIRALALTVALLVPLFLLLSHAHYNEEFGGTVVAVLLRLVWLGLDLTILGLVALLGVRAYRSVFR